MAQLSGHHPVKHWFPLGRLRGIGAALYVHVSVLVAAAVLVLAGVQSPQFAAVTLLSLIAVVLVHETGHVVVAQRLGYSVTSIRFSLIHGRCEYDAPRSRWDEALVAWGGVVAQLIIALPLFAFDNVWHHSLGLLAPVVLILGYWSMVLVVLNLIPARGLDGLKAWQIFPLLWKRFETRRIARNAVERLRDRR
jgi:Zn-dependent protease